MPENFWEIYVVIAGVVSASALINIVVYLNLGRIQRLFKKLRDSSNSE